MNYKTEIKGGELLIRIKCGQADVKKAGLSKSGKTKLLASTGGFTVIDGGPDGMKLNMSVTLPKDE